MYYKFICDLEPAMVLSVWCVSSIQFTLAADTAVLQLILVI